jgi:hypothetical protein
VISAAELHDCGLTPRMIERRVQSGRLHPIHRGVYAVGHADLQAEGRFLAAVKACGPRAALSHFSAAFHWGLLEPTERFPDVTATAPRRRRGINTHRSRSPLSDVVVHRDIPTTTPQRTLDDLKRIGAPETTLTRARRQAQTLGLMPPNAGPRAPTRSVLEDLVLDLILEAGLAHPDVNVPLRIAGATLIPDFRWPQQHLIVEADGAAYHRNTAREDAERQANLEATGERVIRVTYDQAATQRAQTVDRLKQAGAPSA